MPLYDNEGKTLSDELFQKVAGELTECFGGVTAYSRAPAQGLWKMRDKKVTQTRRDELIIFEVMAKELNRAWWKDYRRGLEARFRQQEVIMRVQEVELL